MNGLAAWLATAGLALLMAGALCVIAAVLMASRGTGAWWPVYGMATFGNLAFAMSDAIKGDWPGAVLSVALAVAVLWWWWHLRRKRRDRARHAIGAKSRALLAALVRKAREVTKPRPVLRPVPGGAR